MNSVIYKLQFPAGVHFGKKDVSDTNYTFTADTLFSALVLEALKIGQSELEALYQMTADGELLLSDAFPYIREKLYIPKPFLYVQREKSETSSRKKKVMKKMSYIPVDGIDKFLEQTLDVEKEAEQFHALGKKEEKVCVSIYGEVEPKPYRIGVYRFSENCGLYICVRYGTQAVLESFERLLQSLSYCGIGGERSSGYGRFTFTREEVPICLKERFDRPGDNYMALSVCMAKEDELETVLENASYQLKKKSGFIDSSVPGEQGLRKKDFYVFAAGSCFGSRFTGDVFDVSRNGRHPVYRYAKSMLIEVR